MGNASDFIRGGHGVTFNNGLHGAWVGGRREKIIYLSRRRRDIHTDERTEGRLTNHRQMHVQRFN